VRLVYPVPRDLWIVKLPQVVGGPSTRRKSPKHGTVLDVFDELVSLPELIAHPNFELDVVLTQEEVEWRFDSRRRRRRRGWIVVQRRLLGVTETVSLHRDADYTSMIPAGLPQEFLTSDLASALGCARTTAQKMAYCLRNGGIIHRVGARGNAIVYSVINAASPAIARRRQTREPRPHRPTIRPVEEITSRSS
jgi:hypothetical protein